MFNLFSRYKANYKIKGQVFPFLIALICVVIILIMITVNIGQIGIFKTDVSNAADAGALAGASALSATLLSLGLKSDMIFGQNLIILVFVIVLLTTGVLCPLAIMLWTALVLITWIDLAYARGDARMGWTSAKRTALQYAFNNAGVDEPKPTFEGFLNNAYGISPRDVSASQLQAYYDEYLKGESANSRRYAQPGFSRFMGDNKHGFWKEEYGKIHPRKTSLPKIVSGYGWNDAGGNSYDTGDSYVNYDNQIVVEVSGAKTYGIDLFGLGALFDCVPALLEDLSLPFPFSLITDIIVAIIRAILDIISYITPIGIRFIGDNAEGMTDNNPIIVKVKRYKKENNLGLWRFKYGEISATAVARAFRENGYEDIKPAVLPSKLQGGICAWFGAGIFDWEWFNTERHLFETQLVGAY